MKSRSLPTMCLIILAAAATVRAGENYFEIQVVDDETGRGVPLVVLETTSSIRYVTDSAGRVAFFEPALMGKTVFFYVRSHGYVYPADGFGIRGARLKVEPGGKATIKIHRINMAERLYRLTGQGIYLDSVLLGYNPPLAEPLLDARVMGCDSVMNVVYKGKLYWFWGDTNRPSYPLGNFHCTGATSLLPQEGGLAPGKGVNFNYFTGDDGFVRPMVKIPGSGPTWPDGFITLTDKAGKEHIFAAYTKIKGSLTAYARGLVRYNDETETFEKISEFPVDTPLRPQGHPFKHTLGNTEYVYFATAFPFFRVPATPSDYKNLASYEAFTCLVEGSTLDDPKLDRTASGSLRYSWKHNTPPLGLKQQKQLVESGQLQPEECITLRARDSGKPIVTHTGSVYWNEYRRRWIMIFCESYGESSLLGETWYAEADSPVGPWGYAVKIVTHDKYDFYNPKQHPVFDQDGGKTIFFEGTYTNTFSGNPIQTPRYNYNQVMYKLSLDDPSMALPVPIYRAADKPSDPFQHGAAHLSAPENITFFALDRPGQKSIPIYQTTADSGAIRLSTTPPAENPKQTIAFHAIAADALKPPAATEKLYRWTKGQTIRYATETEERPDGFQRDEQPLCLVWKNPIGYTWPVQQD